MKRGGAPYDDGASYDKRQRNDTNHPSKVLHVRNLPATATEMDLTGLCAPFGAVSKVLLLRGKGQAFVEMVDVQAASSTVEGYQGRAAAIHGNSVYMSFSSRSEVTLPQNTGRGGSMGGMGNMGGMNGMGGMGGMSGMGGMGGMGGMSGGMGGGHAVQAPTSGVLLTSVKNAMYGAPISLPQLYQVFGAADGGVHRIVMFRSKGGGGGGGGGGELKVLVEFGSVEAAGTAQRRLHGQALYADGSG